MAAKAIRLDRVLRKQKLGDEDWVFTRAVDRSMDAEHETLIKDLIGFANEQSPSPERFLHWGRPYCPGGSEVFNKTLAEAHDLTRQCLLTLSQDKPLSKAIADKLNAALATVSERNMFTFENQKSLVWVSYEFPTATAYCAYLIAAVLNAGSGAFIRQCGLRGKPSPCYKFFWAPKRRGQPPSYCCVNHTKLATARKRRGKM